MENIKNSDNKNAKEERQDALWAQKTFGPIDERVFKAMREYKYDEDKQKKNKHKNEEERHLRLRAGFIKWLELMLDLETFKKMKMSADDEDERQSSLNLVTIFFYQLLWTKHGNPEGGYTQKEGEYYLEMREGMKDGSFGLVVWPSYGTRDTPPDIKSVADQIRDTVGWTLFVPGKKQKIERLYPPGSKWVSTVRPQEGRPSDRRFYKPEVTVANLVKPTTNNTAYEDLKNDKVLQALDVLISWQNQYEYLEKIDAPGSPVYEMKLAKSLSEDYQKGTDGNKKSICVNPSTRVCIGKCRRCKGGKRRTKKRKRRRKKSTKKKRRRRKKRSRRRRK